MKPNIVILQPAHIESDAAVDIFCEKLCETHQVCLIRSGSAFRDDSSGGVRFLNNAIEDLPCIAEVEAVITIGGHGLAVHLQKAYPASDHSIWDPGTGNEFLESFLASTKVVHGEFGNGAGKRLDRAM